jgi:Protein of unknown function (DUF1552)
MMRNWNRREFARNAAMLTLFSPFIGMLEPSIARAQAAGGPAKYLLIMTSNGTDPNIWQPLAGSGAGGVNLSPALSTLGPIKNDVILLNKFDSHGTAGNHGSPGGLSAAQYNQTESLDYFVADDLRARGILTQVPSLHLGGVKGQAGISFRNNALQVPQFEVSEAFRTIFDGTAAPPPAAPATPDAPAGPSPTEIRLLRRQSVLDAVRSDISSLEKAFSGLEKEKLELHIASIRELETRIGQQLSIAQGSTATPVTGGGTPAPAFISPVACQQPSNKGGDQNITNSAIHLELATAAFACDITRVAHVEFGHHQSCPVNIPGAQGDWHNDFMHASTDRARLTVTEQFVATQFVNTVNRLKATRAPDGAGTLYDQTFVLWVREMGDAVIHAGTNMPFVVAGGAGGYLRKGNGYLDGGGAFHLRVLMAAAQSMGVTNMANFGDKNAGGADRTPFDGLRA